MKHQHAGSIWIWRNTAYVQCNACGTFVPMTTGTLAAPSNQTSATAA